jgi:two-component system response regulator MprA
MSRRPRVMVVDDDEDILESYDMLLSGAGYQVDTAPSGEIALEKLRAGARPALILLDLMMPTMSGWAFRAQLLAERALADLPVVVFSGDHRALERTPPPAIAAVLKKPVDAATLLATIEKYRRP